MIAAYPRQWKDQDVETPDDDVASLIRIEGRLVAPAQGDANGDGNIGGGDLVIWKSPFGAGGTVGGLAGTAVPEPGTLGLLGLVLVGLAVRFFRHWQGGQIMDVCKISLIVAAVGLFVFAPTAMAGYTLDRQYHLGDDPLDEFGFGAVAGTPVIHTVDSFATSPPGDQQDMVFGFSSTTTYIDVSTVGTGRPGAVSEDLGVELHGPDGSGGGDHLVAARLGAPDTSAASGTLDYSGIVHRGFQAWVYPMAPNGGLQDVIMDTLAHGVRISETGTWVMRYWGDGLDYDTGIAVTEDWHHVQVVQAPRRGSPNRGSTFYLDGVAVAFGPGPYTDGNSPNHPLVLGANSGDDDQTEDDVPDVGTENFFIGVLDEVELFVNGTSTTTSTPYGNFNAGEDNPIIAADWSGIPDGDITRDGNVDDADVDIFVANWRAENLVMGFPVGDSSSRALGDFDYSGAVDFSDWFIIRGAYAAAGGGSLDLGELLAGAGVPEPSSVLLLLLGVAAVGIVRRR